MSDTEDRDCNIIALVPITYNFGSGVSDKFLLLIGAGSGVSTGDETDFHKVDLFTHKNGRFFKDRRVVADRANIPTAFDAESRCMR